MKALKGILAGSLLLLVLGFASSAKANAVSGTLTLTDCGSGGSGCPAATYTFTITNSSATLTVHVTGGVTSANDNITAVDLGFSSSGTVSGLSLVSSPTTGWSATTGSLNSGGNCGANSGAFICASVSPLNSLTIPSGGGTYSWTWDYTLSGSIFTVGNIHIGTEYGPNAGNNFKGLIVSQTGATTVTPEPASLLLLGTGLLTMGGIIRRKLGA
jgi:hypothetical protein